MPLGLAFYILLLLWLVFGLWWAWPGSAQTPYHGYLPLGNSALLFILFLLLGWAVFGAPLKG